MEPIALVIQEEVPVEGEPIPESCNIEKMGECCCKYDAAINLISAAIESLAEIAKDDQLAKDSIANLGVVMLDLKGAC